MGVKTNDIVWHINENFAMKTKEGKRKATAATARVLNWKWITFMAFCLLFVLFLCYIVFNLAFYVPHAYFLFTRFCYLIFGSSFCFSLPDNPMIRFILALGLWVRDYRNDMKKNEKRNCMLLCWFNCTRNIFFFSLNSMKILITAVFAVK